MRAEYEGLNNYHCVPFGSLSSLYHKVHHQGCGALRAGGLGLRGFGGVGRGGGGRPVGGLGVEGFGLGRLRVFGCCGFGWVRDFGVWVF